MEKLNYRFSIQILNRNNIKTKYLNNKKINLIDVNFNFKKPFDKISKKSKNLY